MENNKIKETYYISDLWQKMTQIWPKSAIFEFSQKIRKQHFFRLQRLGLVRQIRIAKKKFLNRLENFCCPYKP